MENIDYVNVEPLPTDEDGGVNKAENTEENQEPTTESTYAITESVSDEEAAAKAQELMRLISDPNVLKAYRNIRGDVYGKKKAHQVSKKDAKKKKAKRSMARKSRKS